MHHFASNPSINTTNPLPHLYLSPLNNAQPVINEEDDPEIEVFGKDLVEVNSEMGLEMATFGESEQQNVWQGPPEHWE